MRALTRRALRSESRDLVDQELGHRPEHDRDPGDGEGQRQDETDSEASDAGVAHGAYIGRIGKSLSPAVRAGPDAEPGLARAGPEARNRGYLGPVRRRGTGATSGRSGGAEQGLPRAGPDARSRGYPVKLISPPGPSGPPPRSRPSSPSAPGTRPPRYP